MIQYLKQSAELSSFVQGYSGFRPDIVKLINSTPSKVLDVGCGAGLLAKEIKDLYSNAEVTGLEADDLLIKKAKLYCNKVIKLDLNNINLFETTEKYDVIIFADILEHLNHPEQILDHLSKFLHNDGYIITSLPNIRHYSTFVSLFLLGIWPQNNRGIHDATHVRFFTKKNIEILLNKTGFKIDKEARNVRLLESKSWTNIPGKLLDFWPFRAFFTFQYLHRSTKL